MSSPPPPDPPPTPALARDASGILAVRTGVLRKRGFRRKLPRPGSGFLLFLLLAVAVGGAAAALHRRTLEREFASEVTLSKATPFEIKRIRRELLDLEVDEKSLANALDTRLKYLENTRRKEFYIAIDTRKREFSFRFADKVLRDAPVEVGMPRTIVSGKKTWTFAPLTGACNVTQNFENSNWKVPEWVYRMDGRKPPKELPTVANGRGRSVIDLGDDYVIHSPPAPDSPLKGVKPGSFMVPDADLAAVWPRVGPATRVYVF